jgi:hypothetical protein
MNAYWAELEARWTQTEGEAWQEHCDYEANAHHDYISEAFGEEARILNEQARLDEEYGRMQDHEDYQDMLETKSAWSPRPWQDSEEIPF